MDGAAALIFSPWGKGDDMAVGRGAGGVEWRMKKGARNRYDAPLLPARRQTAGLEIAADRKRR
jgi:hypothetical protein